MVPSSYSTKTQTLVKFEPMLFEVFLLIHLQIYGGLFEEPVRHSGSQLDTKPEHTQFRFASLETLSSKSTNHRPHPNTLFIIPTSRFHRATAASLIKHFRDCIKGAPRELYANVLLTAGPADQDSLVVIQFCYLGSKEDGLPYLQAISSWDGERCLLNEVNEKSYLFQQDSIAQILRGKGTYLHQWNKEDILILCGSW